MDLNKIRERLNQLESEQKPSGFKRIWKPEPGSTVIRLLPNPKNRDWPFMELGFYYDLTNRTIISPTNFNQPDPVDELAQQLQSTGDTEDWKLGKKLEARRRTYVPILIRGREEEGVFLWGFGKTVFEELLKTMDDPDYGDITDLKTGTDITIEYSKPPKGESGYPKTTFRLKRHSTPVTDNKEVMKLLDDVPQPEDIWDIPSYDELSKVLDNYINNRSEEESTDSQETPQPENEPQSQSTNGDSDFSIDDFSPPSSEPSKGTPIKSKSDDVDAVFDDMFNK